MAILTVGSGKQFSTIVAAVAAAQNGDTINVDAGTYTNQWVHIFTNITLQGVGGMVNLVSTGLIPNGKGIFITDGNITINNFTFSGALVADYNGAGIRQQTGNLVLNNDGFFHNQMGVLTGNSGTLTVNNSEFAYNGVAPGLPAIGHGLYANLLASLTVNNSYFHENSVGHEIKSRALTTTITNSRVYDLNGTASYSIDLPDGGNALIQNNVIEQGPLSQNPHIIIYGEEGTHPLNPGTNFVIDGNTIINDKTGSAIAVHSFTSTIAQITNNKFFGLTAAQIAAGPNTQTGNQFLPTEPLLDTTHPWVQGELSMQLFADTGASATDMITSDPALKGTGRANALVTLKEGGTTLGTATADSTGIWSFTPTNLPDGVHTVTASETDLANNIQTATLSFTLDHTAPAVSIALVSDTGSSAVDGITSNPAVHGVGQANTAVTIKDGATTLGTTMADSSTGAWSFTPGAMANGAHTLTATQTDIAGNIGTGTLSFTLDKTAPAVSMVLPWDTGTSATDKITSNPQVTGHGDANALVTIKEGATTLGTTVASNTGAWSFTPTTLTEGAHTLTATETDLAGNTGVATLSFTLDKTVTMALYTDTGSSATDNITSFPAVKGVGEANTLVTIKDGGTTLGGVTVNSAGTWYFTPTSLADGAHTFSAIQTDLAGDTRTATLSFTFDKTRPVVSMALVSDTGTSSTDKITSNPAVKGHGDASTIVTVKDGATTLGTTMADIAGVWSFAPMNLADGAHTFSATQTDVAGNTGTATLSFTLDTIGLTGVA
jgi:Bacterial Ig-like domain/Bacterial Ig domain